jgi:lipoate-protein ligase A
MAVKTYIIHTDDTNPYRNLAREALLMEWVPEGAVALYLWQNERTVVIGRNQNAWRECRVNALEADGVHLARRMSGGGAVYHDLGNLNFTFLACDADYSVDKQSEVIVNALNHLGINAQRTGRNDIEVNNKKISGNAFYHIKGKAYHHGTILVSVDASAAERYLAAPKARITSNSVPSVRGRIANLTDFNPTVTVAQVSTALEKAAVEVYGNPLTQAPETVVADTPLAELSARLASRSWNYNHTPPFTLSAEGRFPWGTLEARFDVADGCISGVTLYSDALDAEFIEKLSIGLVNAPFTEKAVRNAVRSAGGTEQQAGDVSTLLLDDCAND